MDRGCGNLASVLREATPAKAVAEEEKEEEEKKEERKEYDEDKLPGLEACSQHI